MSPDTKNGTTKHVHVLEVYEMSIVRASLALEGLLSDEQAQIDEASFWLPLQKWAFFLVEDDKHGDHDRHITDGKDREDRQEQFLM